MNAVRARRRAWRRAVALAGNGYRLVVLGGLRSWRRDIPRVAPAAGSIALVLVLAGAFALVGVAVATAASAQAGDASVLTVYLAEDASPQAVDALRTRLAADPRVASVRDISPEDALERARSRPGLGDLADLAGANPFSGSLEVAVRRITDVGAVAGSVSGDPAVDPGDPTSYDPQAYGALRRVAIVVGGVALALVLLLGFVAYTVCANAQRGIALSRRDELALTRLLGARRWMLRGPFVVEGVMTGAAGGAIAGAAVVAGWVTSTRLAAGLYAAVLPGVGARAVELVVAAILAAGLAVGGVSAAFGVRRLTG